MSSTSETGHGKNVVNFKTLIGYCNSYGSRYQPSKSLLQIDSITKMFQEGEAFIGAVNAGAVQFNKATVARSVSFKDIRPFGTRLLNALAASEVAEGTIADAKGVVRKLRGQRAEKKIIEINPDNGETDAQTDRRISVSQQSYDNLVEHLDKLFKLLAAEDGYKPNEEELKTASVQIRVDGLKAANANVINRYIDYSKGIAARNHFLYNPVTGLVEVAKQIKNYILSVFGASSPEYKQVNSIEFRTIK